MEYIDTLNIQLKHAKESLDADLMHNFIDDNQYSKGIIALSYEYSLNGLLDDALLMFVNIKDSYFDTQAVKDLQNEDYYHKCLFLLELFDYMDLTPFDLRCTQKGGKA